MEKKTFKQRVSDFWECFQQEEQGLRELIDNSAGSREIIDSFQKILNIAFDNVYFNVGHNTNYDKYELTLSPEGNRTTYYYLWYWLRQAPDILKENWNFYASKPATDNNKIEFGMYGERIGANDLTIYVVPEEERNILNLQVYAPKLTPLEDNQKYNMFFIFLDLFISELYTMNYIGSIDFIDREQDGTLVPLTELKDFIEKMLEDRNETFSEEPNSSFTVYELNIEEPQYLREDIFIGNAANMSCINNYYNEENAEFETAEANGIVWGFIYYDNSEVPQEEMTGFRGEIEDEYLSIMEEEKLGVQFGGATGGSYSYIDFVIYDLPAFLSLSNKIAKKFQLRDCGFSPFKKGADITQFTK